VVVNIVLQRYGEIPEERVRKVLSTIEESYERLRPHGVEILDLLLFAGPSDMSAFYSREQSILRVVSEGFDEGFIAMHDAWRGTSRIGVCMSKMGELPGLVQIGSLRHEVGHSVVHGSIEYYVFPIYAPLMDAAKRARLSEQYCFNLVYLISIAVKDFEVTRLLSGKGYVNDQFAYSNHVLRTSTEDLDAWQLSKGNPAGMALCLAGRLKDAACLIALQPRLGHWAVTDRIRSELSYLPDRVLTGMLKTLKRFAESMAGDTFQNVAVMTKVFVEDILQTLYTQS